MGEVEGIVLAPGSLFVKTRIELEKTAEALEVAKKERRNLEVSRIYLDFFNHEFYYFITILIVYYTVAS